MKPPNAFVIALRTAMATLALTGLAYPLAVTGLAQLMFPASANGSLIRDQQSRVLGSALIGQRFAGPAYFHSRPSAAGPDGYDATASSGSNLGPTSRKLRERVRAEARRLSNIYGGRTRIPAELLTASASGLDPHLSPEAALWQVGRVARARAIAPETLAILIERSTEPRDLGFLGEPRVNLLRLNLALQSLERDGRK